MRPQVITGLIVFLLLVIASGVFYAYRTLTIVDRSTPQATVTGYFHALSAQDYAAAWHYDADSRNNPSAQTVFIQSVQADDANYGVVRSASITQITPINSSQVAVSVSVLRGDSQTQMSYMLNLIQYNGSEWYILDISNQ